MLVNVFVLWYLTRGDTEHVNVKGAILHVMGDLLGSIGAIVAAVTIMYTGWTPIDPILSVLVSLLVLRSAWVLFKRTIHILLEGAPADASSVDVIAHLLKAVDGIEKVSHVHVWMITSGRTMATLHVQPKAGVDVPTLTKRVEQELRDKFNIEHPTVAIDWDGNHTCSLEDTSVKINPDAGHEH
jgi:cobalt-zinc-cadmium efflux system protein